MPQSTVRVSEPEFRWASKKAPKRKRYERDKLDMRIRELGKLGIGCAQVAFNENIITEKENAMARDWQKFVL